MRLQRIMLVVEARAMPNIGFPITQDEIALIPQPTLTTISNILSNRYKASYWSNYITKKDKEGNVQLLSFPCEDHLSEIDKKIIKETFDKCQKMADKELQENVKEIYEKGIQGVFEDAGFSKEEAQEAVTDIDYYGNLFTKEKTSDLT